MPIFYALIIDYLYFNIVHWLFWFIYFGMKKQWGNIFKTNIYSFLNGILYIYWNISLDIEKDCQWKLVNILFFFLLLLNNVQFIILNLLTCHIHPNLPELWNIVSLTLCFPSGTHNDFWNCKILCWVVQPEKPWPISILTNFSRIVELCCIIEFSFLCSLVYHPLNMILLVSYQRFSCTSGALMD